MIHIFCTHGRNEIKKIQTEYFNEESERYKIPVLVHPDEGIDLDDSEMAQSLIDRIIEVDDNVVICHSDKFKDLLSLSVSTRKAAIAGNRMRITLTSALTSMAGIGLSDISRKPSEREKIKSALSEIGVDANDEDIDGIIKVVSDANNAGIRMHWTDIPDLLTPPAPPEIADNMTATEAISLLESSHQETRQRPARYRRSLETPRLRSIDTKRRRQWQARR